MNTNELVEDLKGMIKIYEYLEKININCAVSKFNFTLYIKVKTDFMWYLIISPLGTAIL